MLLGRFATRSRVPLDDEALRLVPLDGAIDDRWVAWRGFEEQSAAERSGGEVWSLILAVTGRWQGRSAYAVDAEWRVPERGYDEFVGSRLDLFFLRRAVFASFAVDCLFRDVVDPTRLLVLGLYGHEADLRLSRDHPRIARLASERPLSVDGVAPLTKLRFYRVASDTPPARG